MKVCPPRHAPGGMSVIGKGMASLFTIQSNSCKVLQRLFPDRNYTFSTLTKNNYLWL